jgi:uncharacterized protein
VSTTTPDATTARADAVNGAAGAGGNGPAGANGANGAPARRPGRRERKAILLSVGAIIIYLVLAYLVFVRPGVSRSEHLLAVLLPAAILALSADLWPRLAAGLRASLALLYGVFALVTGIVSMARLSVEGTSAAGLCGLLPLAAGVVLIVLGVWLLWVSRKRGGTWWWTLARRALLLVGALLVVYWVVLPVSLAIFATERPSEPVKDVDLGRPYEDVTLTTRDGLELSAWYVPSLNHAAVITFPREWTIAQARMLAKSGYGVLLVDPRGYGDSQGDPNAYGWGSTKDIDAAVAWLRRRADVQRGRIGGLGLSMGGEQMIEAAARNRGLKAVVSEGAGIRSVLEATLPRGESPLELALRYPQDLVQTISVWLLSGEPIPMSLDDASLLIGPRATFFIYGEDGQEIEKTVNPVYYAAAFPSKSIWEVPGAGHTQGIETQPKEYKRLVLGFFDRTLLGAE